MKSYDYHLNMNSKKLLHNDEISKITINNEVSNKNPKINNQNMKEITKMTQIQPWHEQ
jgi:hypothetical protein